METNNRCLWQFATCECLLMRYRTEDKFREKKEFRWKVEKGEMRRRIDRYIGGKNGKPELTLTVKKHD